MSDFEDGSSLVESISGRWHRCKSKVAQGAFLIEWPHDVLLAVHVSVGKIDILTKNENEVFEYTAEFSAYNDDGIKVHLFSNAINQVHFNDKDHVVSNDLAAIKSVIIELDLAKKRI